MKRELQLSEIAPYLPYGVKGELTRKIYPKGKQIIEVTVHNINKCKSPGHDIKPILRPMCDLNIDHPAMIEINEIHSLEYNEGNTFIEIDSIDNDPFDVKYIPYTCFTILLKHHIDVFNLIPDNLAIDVNTIESEVPGE